MNPKTMKMLIKFALSLGVASAVGYTMKLEAKVGERIDEHFDKIEDN